MLYLQTTLFEDLNLRTREIALPVPLAGGGRRAKRGGWGDGLSTRKARFGGVRPPPPPPQAGEGVHRVCRDIDASLQRCRVGKAKRAHQRHQSKMVGTAHARLCPPKLLPPSIRRCFSRPLQLHRLDPPRQIIGEAGKRLLQRFAALADRLSFPGPGFGKSALPRWCSKSPPCPSRRACRATRWRRGLRRNGRPNSWRWRRDARTTPRENGR